VIRGSDKRTRDLVGLAGSDRAQRWVQQVLRNIAFKGYIRDASGIGEDEIGVPVAVLPSMDEIVDRSPSLGRGGAAIARMLDEIRDTSPVLLLKPSIVRKQLRSRRDDIEEFHWTEYQKIQSLLEKAKVVEFHPVSKGIRSVCWAVEGRNHYAIVWDAETRQENGRNSLVSFYRIYDFESWLTERKRRQRKQLRKEK